MFGLLWLELGRGRSETIFINKLPAEDLVREPGSQDWEAPLASHGGEEESRGILMSSAASFLPAGLGGEGARSGGWSVFAPGSRSKFCDECGVGRWLPMFSFSLSRHGGVGSEGDGAAACFNLRWSLLKRCYFDKLIHAKGNLASAIFC
jgi:hypothetical protein